MFGLDNSVPNTLHSGQYGRYGTHEYWHLQAIEVTGPKTVSNLPDGTAQEYWYYNSDMSKREWALENAWYDGLEDGYN
jgi:hypothetical protein